MTFVPDRSIGATSGGANVFVTNFPADQLVHFTTPVDVNIAASAVTVPVSGPMTDAQFAAHLPFTVAVSSLPTPVAVTGPLTDAQLAARLPLTVAVSSVAVTVPVSVATLPLPAGAATEETLNDVALTAILEREKVPPE